MATKYRGKYPHRINEVFRNNAGDMVVRLNNGERYIALPKSGHSPMPKPGQELSAARVDSIMTPAPLDKTLDASPMRFWTHIAVTRANCVTFMSGGSQHDVSLLSKATKAGIVFG